MPVGIKVIHIFSGMSGGGRMQQSGGGATQGHIIVCKVPLFYYFYISWWACNTRRTQAHDTHKGPFPTTCHASLQTFFYLRTPRPLRQPLFVPLPTKLRQPTSHGIRRGHGHLHGPVDGLRPPTHLPPRLARRRPTPPVARQGLRRRRRP